MLLQELINKKSICSFEKVQVQFLYNRLLLLLMWKPKETWNTITRLLQSALASPQPRKKKSGEKYWLLKTYLTIIEFAPEGKKQQIKKAGNSFSYNHLTKPDHSQLADFCLVLCFMCNIQQLECCHF